MWLSSISQTELSTPCRQQSSRSRTQTEPLVSDECHSKCLDNLSARTHVVLYSLILIRNLIVEWLHITFHMLQVFIARESKSQPQSITEPPPPLGFTAANVHSTEQNPQTLATYFHGFYFFICCDSRWSLWTFITFFLLVSMSLLKGSNLFWNSWDAWDNPLYTFAKGFGSWSSTITRLWHFAFIEWMKEPLCLVSRPISTVHYNLLIVPMHLSAVGVECFEWTVQLTVFVPCACQDWRRWCWWS